jgi:succinyl-diaminopimelate desuccinylase
MESPLIERIRASAETLRPSMEAFLCDFLRIDTENPPGRNYERCVRFLGEKMASLGCDVEYIEVPEEALASLPEESKGWPRHIVIGTYRGTRERPAIHFSGHYDVVPAGGGWTADPYGGRSVGGKIYGRGASDMKSGIVAQIFALETLLHAGIRLKGSFVSSAVPDEETGGETGTGYLVRSGRLTKETADYCIITEPLDPDMICLGHRGTLWFTLAFKGVQSHGSMPSEGLNPIEGMRALLERIDQHIRPELERVSKYPVSPERSRKSTLCITTIQAGTKVNTIPDTCTASFDWRLIPEQSVEWAKGRILSICDELVREGVILEYIYTPVIEANPTMVEESQPLVDALKRCGKAVLGKEMGINFSPGMDDQRFAVHEGGIGAAVVYGPGRLALAHKSDEHISLDDLVNGVEIMAAVAAEMLGTEE